GRLFPTRLPSAATMPRYSLQGSQDRVPAMQPNRDERRVVLTGCGVITPLGHTPEAVVDRWAQGMTAAAPLKRLDATLLPSKVAAEILDFLPHEHIQSRKLLRLLQRGEDFALAAAA